MIFMLQLTMLFLPLKNISFFIKKEIDASFLISELVNISPSSFFALISLNQFLSF